MHPQAPKMPADKFVVKLIHRPTEKETRQQIVCLWYNTLTSNSAVVKLILSQ